jgi:hypothetical protein
MCVKINVTWCQRRKDYPTYNEKKEGEFIGDILRRKCLLRHGIEGTTEGRKEVVERRRRRLSLSLSLPPCLSYV